MAVKYFKKAPLHSQSDATETHDIVFKILNEIEVGVHEKAIECATKFDKYMGVTLLHTDAIEAASELVPDKMKRDIKFAHSNVENLRKPKN